MKSNKFTKAALVTVVTSANAQTSGGQMKTATPTSTVDTHLASDRTIGRIEPVFEFHGAMPTGGEKGASDGLESDDKGRVYAGDYESNSIRQLQTNGEWQTIAHDPRILWPDTLSVASNGYLYFTANQLHRQPQFNEGVDRREKPYVLFV